MPWMWHRHALRVLISRRQALRDDYFRVRAMQCHGVGGDDHSRFVFGRLENEAAPRPVC
jgi:hypothetical protein